MRENAGKMQTRITLNKDNFYAVTFSRIAINFFIKTFDIDSFIYLKIIAFTFKSQMVGPEKQWIRFFLLVVAIVYSILLTSSELMN